ncbi:MAG: hypothetical protein SFV52_12370 [Saprospiraceae bacterium]|nr:hypothetical protein [Saprospiraceae bacterium]
MNKKLKEVNVAKCHCKGKGFTTKKQWRGIKEIFGSFHGGHRGLSEGCVGQKIQINRSGLGGFTEERRGGSASALLCETSESTAVYLKILHLRFILNPPPAIYLYGRKQTPSKSPRPSRQNPNQKSRPHGSQQDQYPGKGFALRTSKHSDTSSQKGSTAVLLTLQLLREKLVPSDEGAASNINHGED